MISGEMPTSSAAEFDMGAGIRREIRIALSRRAQPLWFRALKWVVILTLIALFWGRAWFWWAMLGAVAVAVAAHLLYRHKTYAWTRPWGGWDDLPAGRDQ
jgi:hypothetical protein